MMITRGVSSLEWIYAIVSRSRITFESNYEWKVTVPLKSKNRKI